MLEGDRDLFLRTCRKEWVVAEYFHSMHILTFIDIVNESTEVHGVPGIRDEVTPGLWVEGIHEMEDAVWTAWKPFLIGND